jgi:hypothetical protein
MSAGLTRLAAVVLAISALLFAGGQPAADKPAEAPVDPSYQQSTPARAGSFEIQGGDVTAKFLPDAHATIEGKPVTTAKLQPDTSGNRTVVELGSLRMHVIVRGQRTGIRVKDLNSAAVRDYRGPVFFPLDPAYRITATWVPSHGKRTVDVPNVLGDVTPTPVAGEVRFKLNGQELRLADLGGEPSKGLSFVFSDLTGKTDNLPGRPFPGHRPGSKREGRTRFQPRLQPALRRHSLCHLPPGSEGEQIECGYSGGREIRPGERASLIQEEPGAVDAATPGSGQVACSPSVGEHLETRAPTGCSRSLHRSMESVYY